MKIEEILLREPVNRLAAAVTSQRRVATLERDMSRKELADIVARIARKRRLLKRVLGIKTQSQQTNLMIKFNKGLPQYRANKEPRAFTEYVALGRQMAMLNKELSEMRRARRFAAEAEQEMKANKSPTTS